MSHPDFESTGHPTDRAVEEIGELMVELGATLKAVGKAKRFGLHNRWPATNVTNLEALLRCIDGSLREIPDVTSTLTGLRDLLQTIQQVRAVAPVFLNTEQAFLDLFKQNAEEHHLIVAMDPSAAPYLHETVVFRDCVSGTLYATNIPQIKERRLGRFNRALCTLHRRRLLADYLTRGTVPDPLHL